MVVNRTMALILRTVMTTGIASLKEKVEAWKLMKSPKMVMIVVVLEMIPAVQGVKLVGKGMDREHLVQPGMMLSQSALGHLEKLQEAFIGWEASIHQSWRHHCTYVIPTSAPVREGMIHAWCARRRPPHPLRTISSTFVRLSP